MRIKQLDIIGFKSFPDSLTLRFPEGICAVVGPNGCGKSNIVDALRWVMGEQSVKQLRGKSMEDIIFSGSEGKGPVNLAEVAVTLMNENGNAPEEYRHLPEIMVSRRLFRSGESGYFINKQPCRLKDIQNLLMGTGVGSRNYAVVEQGKIASIIDAGPDELRFFIEEAAGITRYKSRKKEALLKIQRTQHNLLRIHDVIIEVKRQMNSLKRQAKKAERYKTFQAKIEELEIALATFQYRTISTEMEETEKLLESLRDTDFKHESELATLDAAIEKVKQERTAQYRRISEEKARSHDLERTIDRLEGNIQHGTKDVERLEGDIEVFHSEVAEIEHKNQQIAEESRSLEERKSHLLEDTQKIKGTLGQEAAVEQAMRQRLGGLNKDLEAKKTELVNLASRKATYENALNNASKQRSNLSRRLDQLKGERAETEKDLDRLQAQMDQAQDHHGALKKDLDEIGAALEISERRLQQNRTSLSEQVRKVQTAEVERQKARSHYGALRKMDEGYEWFKKGVRVVMRQWESEKLKESGIHGLVADVIEPEPSYEEAAEAALAETLQYVIVKDQQGGRTAIDFLRGDSGGRAGFIPMEAIRPLVNADPHPRPEEGCELLVDHIKIREGYERLARSLIGHVIVADDLEAALRLWNNNGSHQAIVTRQGDRVCLQGILTGGSRGNGDSGILAKKKEVKELAARIAKLDQAVAVAEDRQKELEKEAVALEIEVQKARQAQADKTREQLELEKELYRLQESLRHARRHLEVLHLEEQQIAGEQTDVEQELSNHEGVLAELAQEIQADESAVEQMQAQIREISEKAESANQKVVELKLRVTSLQAEYDSSENTLRRLTEFQQDRRERLAQLKRGLRETEEDKAAMEQRLAEDRAKMADLYAELRAMEEKLSQREGEYQAIEGKLQQNDQALCEVRTRKQETLEKMQQVELKQSERRMRRDYLVSWIQERHRQNIQILAEGYSDDGFSEEETEKALAAYRERMAKIGDVNLTAIQEYEALSERYRLLTEQCADLEGAIETLHRVIRRINRVSLKQFMKTFKAVNEKVKDVFPRLFEGGTANLVLTSPRRPLESGVSFLVRPPGKKVTCMSLLSGGEKALSAITLIFSLFMIKPTAFCVLDEIDAPLDEVNVSRFNYLLQEIGKESQVIMVTHNRQTMEMADELLGVTMEEKGVSKLVSLNLARDRTGGQSPQESVSQAS
jgi:chromosome segregation protein